MKTIIPAERTDVHALENQLEQIPPEQSPQVKQQAQPTADEQTAQSDPLAANSKTAWDSIPIPSGWQLTPLGLYREFQRNGQIQTELTSGPIWISAIAYGNQKITGRL